MARSPGVAVAVRDAAFPAARRNRVGPAPAAFAGAGDAGGGGAPSMPSVRLWPFLVQARVGTLRSTAVSLPIRGPAVVTTLSLQMYGQELSAIPAVTLIYSNDDSGAQVNGANLALPSGTPIFDPFGNANVSNSPVGGPAFQTLGGAGARNPFEWTVGVPVMLDRFFLKLSVQVNSAAQDISVMGFVRVVEGLSPEQIPGFL